MAGIIRDIQCGMDVARMAELGRYDKEFLAYGFSWWENDERAYYISGEGTKIYQVLWEKLIDQKCVTPVEQLMRRCTVPSGMAQTYSQENKVALAKYLQKNYTLCLFEALQSLSETEADDRALIYLQYLQEHLEGSFDRDKLNYFRALLDQTRIAKKISEHQYELMKQWLKKTYKQMENDIVVEEQYERTLGGFYYQTKMQTWSLYINADPILVYETWEKHLKVQDVVLPIFWKRYWFAAVQEGSLLRKRFKTDYDMLLGDGFAQIFHQIKKLPSVISKKNYQLNLEKITEEGTEADRKAFLTMGAYWDIEHA